MVEREHGVGLAATKVGLELDDRVSAGSREAAQGASEQRFETLGQVGAGEELSRVLVLRGGATKVDLLEVGRKLGVLVNPLGHVVVRGNDVTPRGQLDRALRGNRCFGRLLAFSS